MHVSRIGVNCPETNEGLMLVHLASKNGHFEISQNKTWKTLFDWAAENGFVNICHLIVLYAYDKNPGDMMGLTPLHVAASKGHLSICQLIILNIGEDKNPRETFVGRHQCCWFLHNRL